MEELNDDHGSESVRKYVRTLTDIKVNVFVKGGNNGLVYFGTRTKLNDEVALKFYGSYPHFDSSEEPVILKRIKHPNILEVYDLKFVPPVSGCFISPRIMGGDLQGHIDGRSISSREALKFTSGILSGVAELHANHGLVHRDLKPANILLHLDTMTPIIADLGAVKKIDVAHGYTSESKATFYYLPPECIIDKKYYFQSDLYQVGLIFFQLVGGFFPVQEPFRWLSSKEITKLKKVPIDKKDEQIDEFIASKIVKGKLADTNTLPPYLDPAFKRLLNRALHFDSSSRFQNSSEFLKEITKLIGLYPSYRNTPDYLHVVHDNGTEYRIFQEETEFFIDRRLPGKQWRKDNSHDNTFGSVLSIARIS
jgi:serine/threonine protein kinase